MFEDIRRKKEIEPERKMKIRWIRSPLFQDFLHEFEVMGIKATSELRRQVNPAYTFKIRMLTEELRETVFRRATQLSLPVWQGKGKEEDSVILSFCNRRQMEQFWGGVEIGDSFLQEFQSVLENFDRENFVLHLRDGRKLDLSAPVIMGILNVTPDSFSDGGEFSSPQLAVQQALKMVEEGAQIIDIGGESTRPGSEAVSPEEEWKRVGPVLRELRKKTEVPISVDTYKAEVARRAIEEGADIINDISGLTFDPDMAPLVAEARLPLILMHIQGTPRNMQQNPTYRNLMEEIEDFLYRQIQVARAAGIEQLVVDPGIGFGKRWEDNFEIIRRIEELKGLGFPVLIGSSRKSFIGRLLNVPPKEREWGTAASVAASVLLGARILRVHRVSEMKQVLEVSTAISRLKAITD